MCKKCGLTISPENAMGIVYLEEHWHRDCFLCSNPKCGKSLVGIPIHSSKDQNEPYCAECYDELFAKRCAACTKIISGVIGSKFISYEDRHFHQDCFVCKLCQTNLANRKFCPDGKDILCGPCMKYMRVWKMSKNKSDNRRKLSKLWLEMSIILKASFPNKVNVIFK